jgi:AcrR family transcriptional regulator
MIADASGENPMRQGKSTTRPRRGKTGTAKEAPPRRTSIGARRNLASSEAILDAAEAILKESGAGGFSIEAVARRAGAGKPTIYRWWPNKVALLLDVYARQKLELPSTDTGSLESDLQMIIAGIFRFWTATAAGQIFRSIIAEAQSDPAAMLALRTYMVERIEENAAIFERARKRHQLCTDADVHVLAELFSGYLWERLLLDSVPSDPNEIAAVARHLAQKAGPID